MNNTVEVVRHIRHHVGGWYPADVSNMHGITVVFTIDYEDKYVSASWSVCHDVNFDRKEGIRRAKLNNQGLMFPLENVKGLGGLVYALSVATEAWSTEYFEMRAALNKVNDRIRRFRKENDDLC